jgi:hypothetical protein
MRSLLVFVLLVSGCEGCGVEWCEILPVDCAAMAQYVPNPDQPLPGRACKNEGPVCGGPSRQGLECVDGVWRNRPPC